ncbi:MAG: chloride channel protein [Eggerthellaceae bacterium]|nr:chloride channel protein [Eggerthellaceae bacterium]
MKIAAAFAATVCATVVLTVLLSLAVDVLSGIFSGNEFLALGFPLAGLGTWLVYRAVDVPFTWGTGHIVGNVEADGDVSARVIPAVFLGTCATILVGGSVGKEAAALQMGGGAAASIARMLGLDRDAGRMLCACALSSALSALLGAPIAGALFAIEVMQLRSRRLLDYVAIMAAALISKAAAYGLSLDRLFADISVPDASFKIAGHVLLVSILCALLAMGFCFSLKLLRSLSSRRRRQLPLLIAAGVAFCVFILLCGGGAYSGTGMVELNLALSGVVNTPFFAPKALFTLLVLGMGFKGGEIMPTLCIGATLGSFYGHVAGIEPSFMAALALIAYFSACTNCPAAAFALACEAFGVSAAGWFFISSVVACVFSYRFSLYSNTSLYSGMVKGAGIKNDRRR